MWREGVRMIQETIIWLQRSQESSKGYATSGFGKLPLIKLILFLEDKAC